MTQLRLEADNAVTRAEDAEEKLKKYDQLLLEKDQEITSMTHKVSVLEAELDKVDGKLAEAKAAQEEGDSLKGANENLTRKVALLEEELDAAEKNVKETMEKYTAYIAVICYQILMIRSDCDKLMSRQNTSNVKFNESSKSAINGRRSVKYVVTLFDVRYAHRDVLHRKRRRSSRLRRHNWMN
jgi:chromosome segregation ATPase